SWFDPTNYLTGKLPVVATGRLQTGNGVGRFELESASVGGVPVPKLLLQEIVSHYSRSAENPSGFNIDDPFSLPARIREIQVERGQAIIVHCRASGPTRCRTRRVRTCRNPSLPPLSSLPNASDPAVPPISNESA